MLPGQRRVEQAIDALRRGHVVRLAADGAAYDVIALDMLDDAARAMLGPASLVISGRRAETLKITQAGAAAGQSAIALHVPADQPLGALLAIADPVDDLAWPMKGPFQLDPSLPGAAREAGIALAKLARLLPACLMRASSGVAGTSLVDALEIARYPQETADRLRIVTRARVPLAAAEETEIIAFRADDGALEHLALVIGDPPRDHPVLARLHSECFTGDLLGSLKCDCGSQLQGALAAIRAAGSGVLLYLAQEGRGIGLINKLRAYALQDQGFDTVDANTRLGFDIDERRFAPAAQMLKLLGFGAVRLMTNNPDKVKALEAFGIRVANRVAHQFPSNDHNSFYLATKRQRTGHLID
jgi:GTP cyclohydrolase II